MLSFGIEASRAFWIASARAGFPSGSPPPSRAATVIARVSFVKRAPRLASTAFFLCLIDAHFECPAMNFKSMYRKPMFSTRMLGLRESLSRQLHHDGNLWDDGPLPDFTSGLMWTVTGVFGGVALALPGSDRTHVTLALGLAFFSVAWGLISLGMAARGRGMSIEVRALVTAVMMPIVALSLWATGGSTSFIQPVMIFTALFISYFFPPRLAWPLIALFGYAYATPMFYDDRALEVGYPARLLMFVLAVGGAMIAVQFLKGRLVRAELHQRTMAELDPLTGVANRRGFDMALERAAATGVPYALILIDLDDFKRVNDEQGHPAGDAVLQSVARSAAGVARQGDCLARIGGDEFALVAPGAGPAGALRLLRDLREAVEPPATFAAALAPEDARTPEELVSCADERLLAQKRDVKRSLHA
jgi:diguanylate cyclase (GGDEF)-like protein